VSVKALTITAVSACLIILVALGLLFPVMIFGTSMEPSIPSGSGGIALKTGNYDKGDVVVYDTEYGTVIHRIVGRNDGGFVTKGDAKKHVDPWRPKEGDIKGEVLITIPYLGTALRLLSTPLGLGAVMSLLVVWALLPWAEDPLYKRKRRRRGSDES